METKPSEMTTLTEVLEQLRQKRMDNEFTFTEKGFTIDKKKFYKPEDLAIIRTYRFEGESDPADSSIVYLIKSNDDVIGYHLGTYGAYSDHEGASYDEFIKKIPVDERDEQEIFSQL